MSLESRGAGAYDLGGGGPVKYGIAWLLGVPFVLIIVWFLFDRM